MLKILFILIIDFYQVCISPFTQPACRFYPTCSHYARESLVTHGFIRGIYLTFRRLIKCHPFNEGGFDPVPPIKK